MSPSATVTNRFGEKLEILLQRPADSDHPPGILLVSGFGMDLHEAGNSNDEFSRHYLAAGWATLQFSFAGCGNSEGDDREMTLERQARQIEDMLIWLKAQDGIDGDRIGIHATSFGVPSTLLTNLFDPVALVFISGAVDPYGSLKQVFTQRGAYTPAGVSTLPRSTGSRTSVGPGFWKSLAAFRPEQAASLVSQPTLVVHGQLDRKVATADVERFFRVLGSEQKSLRLYPDGDHGFHDVPPETRAACIADAVQWFTQWL